MLVLVLVCVCCCCFFILFREYYYDGGKNNFPIASENKLPVVGLGVSQEIGIAFPPAAPPARGKEEKYACKVFEYFLLFLNEY